MPEQKKGHDQGNIPALKEKTLLGTGLFMVWLFIRHEFQGSGLHVPR